MFSGVIFKAKMEQFFEEEQRRIDTKREELESVDRSSTGLMNASVSDALTGAVGRKLANQPIAKLAKGAWKDRFKSILDKNLNDVFDRALQDINPLGAQVFGGLMNMISLDPNRSLFDIVQRASEDIIGTSDLLSGELGSLSSIAESLRDEIAVVLPSQGDWFSDSSTGFINNLRTVASKTIDDVDGSLAGVMKKLDKNLLPRTDELDALKSSLQGLREQLVPLNADMRPGEGSDHPQANVLASIANLKRLRDELQEKMESVKKLHERVGTKKSGVSNFFSDENTKAGGDSHRREFKKTMRRFSEMIEEIRATVSDSTGTGGIGSVFNNQEAWVTQIEGMMTILDRPLLQVGTTEEGDEDFDGETADLMSKFGDMKTAIESIEDFDIGDMESAVESLTKMASSCLGQNGFDIAEDLNPLLDAIQGGGTNYQSVLSSLTSSIGGSDFMSGIVSKLPQVTSFMDMMKNGDLDTARDFFLSGKMFDQGLAAAGIHGIDSVGSFAEQLRTVFQEKGSEITELGKARIEKAHSILTKNERRKQRVAQTYEKDIEQAKIENERDQAALDDMKRQIKQRFYEEELGGGAGVM